MLCLAGGIGIGALGGLAACAQLSSTAKAVDPKLTAACDAAMALSSLAGPYAAYIDAGCGSVEAIAKLAEDPSSLDWLNQLIADVRKFAAK